MTEMPQTCRKNTLSCIIYNDNIQEIDKRVENSKNIEKTRENEKKILAFQ